MAPKTVLDTFRAFSTAAAVTILFFSSSEVSTSELWKEHEFKPGLIGKPPWQGLDHSEEDFGDDRRVVVKWTRLARTDGALHRGIKAGVNYSLERRPHAEFKKIPSWRN